MKRPTNRRRTLKAECQGMAEDILIVDDEDDIRLLIAGVLEDEGYETRDAANAEQAI